MSGKIPYDEAADRPKKEPFASVKVAGKDPYEQVPLDISDPTSIRLLEILPDMNEDSIISCRLHSATTNDKYTALSYMWGPEEDQKTIKLNGIKMLARWNLWSFLRQKRIDQRRDGSQMFWIDALCINQAGLAKRNHQVAMMGKIYSQASNVLVWLGVRENLMKEFEKASKGDHTVGGLIRFFEDQYWRRAWIRQECVLANLLEFQCGPFKIKEDYVLRTHSDILSGSYVLRIRHYWYKPDVKVYFDPISARNERSQCSDVRDRVYSILALMDPKKGITPDYSKTTVEVFQEVAEKFIVWDRESIFNLDCLATMLDLKPGDLWENVYERAWNPGIRDLLFQANLIHDFDFYVFEETDFRDRWDNYVKDLPVEARVWLQTSRAGQQLPAAARDCIGKSCKIYKEEAS
ncbi:hypothetical protein E8E13_000964 [Curvularia kusanoi]|uniref:Heterokaryon incompatibility domain-containing protein n=1 Tax=Curvularia kusanoi TaxID=90978 RepID=A0A9P4T5T5_CURKU|nr:hypothetical protein E8E13_000964 [Curvularia kusanoi]